MKCDKSGMFIRTTRMAMRKYDQLAASYLCYKPTRMTCIEVLITPRVALGFGYFPSEFPFFCSTCLVGFTIALVLRPG